MSWFSALFSKASTMSPLQQLLSMQQMALAEPANKEATKYMVDLSGAPKSDYIGTDISGYIRDVYDNPARFALKDQIGNMRNTNELHSYGQMNREMGARNSYMDQVRQASIGKVNSERDLQQQAWERAFGNRMGALNSLGQQLGTLTSTPVTENIIQQKDLLTEAVKSVKRLGGY